MSNKWIRVDKAHEGGPRIFRAVSVSLSHHAGKVSSGQQSHNYIVRVFCFIAQVESAEDQVREKLLLVQKGSGAQLEEKEKNELKKRKLLSEV